MSPSRFETIIDLARQSKVIDMSLSERDERPVLPDECQMIEARFGIKLPSDFLYFAQRFGGGGFAFITVLSLLRESEFFVGHSIGLVGPKFFPVIDNHCGDFYGFRVADGQCSDALYFADHETGYQCSETEYPNFLTFVVREGLRFDETRAE